MAQFDIENQDGDARAGTFKVNEREAKTPFFMPVATNAGVKTLISEDLQKLGVEVIISNMYHLLIKTGVDIIEQGGGLHKFMNWDGIIFTDSGGFQMIRNGFDQDFSEEGVKFRSDYDGSLHELTPKENIQIQKRMGSDIAICLDYFPPYPAEEELLIESLERTSKWAKRCRDTGDNIFGISQGGTDPGLRERSCREIKEIGFDGYALGGLSIGEPTETMYEMIEIGNRIYPEDKPRYVMGLGSPVEMLESIDRGMDIFDSAYPTRNARHNTLFTKDGRINIQKSKFKTDYTPIDEECSCPICKNYTKAYIHHLSKAEELAWMRMTSIHNLHFILQLVRDAREAILEQRFKQFKNNFIKRYQ